MLIFGRQLRTLQALNNDAQQLLNVEIATAKRQVVNQKKVAKTNELVLASADENDEVALERGLLLRRVGHA